MQTITFLLTPLDLLFFRDGRPFTAGAQVRSGLPQPQTVAGALRTWLLEQGGCDFSGLGQAISDGQSFAEALAAQGDRLAALGRVRFRGPWFAKDGAPLLSVPATLRKEKPATLRKEKEEGGKIIRLDPLKDPLPGWHSKDGLLPLWHKGSERLEPVSGYVTLEGMASFLKGDVPAQDQLVSAGDLHTEDRRSSVALSPERLTAASGQLFSVGFLALKPDVGLLVEADLPKRDGIPGEAEAILRLGGEGRQVLLRRLDRAIAWPRMVPDAGRRSVVLTTPGLFASGWKPAGLKPLAAAVPSPLAVSGWDLARGGPKPTRFAVPAGAVYFVNDPLAQPYSGSLADGEDAAIGWGCYLEGTWNHV